MAMFSAKISPMGHSLFCTAETEPLESSQLQSLQQLPRKKNL